jgi:hypothetical protein
MSWFYGDEKNFNILSLSDFTAGIVGYIFAEINGGSTGMKQAGQSFIVSLFARAIAEAGFLSFFKSLNTSQKNEIFVGVLSGVASKMRGKGVIRGMINGVSIDLIAEDLIKMFGLSDVNLLTYGSDGLSGNSPYKPLT